MEMARGTDRHQEGNWEPGNHDHTNQGSGRQLACKQLWDEAGKKQGLLLLALHDASNVTALSATEVTTFKPSGFKNPVS